MHSRQSPRNPGNPTFLPEVEAERDDPDRGHPPPTGQSDPLPGKIDSDLEIDPSLETEGPSPKTEDPPPETDSEDEDHSDSVVEGVDETSIAPLEDAGSIEAPPPEGPDRTPDQ